MNRLKELLNKRIPNLLGQVPAKHVSVYFSREDWEKIERLLAEEDKDDDDFGPVNLNDVEMDMLDDYAELSDGTAFTGKHAHHQARYALDVERYGDEAYKLWRCGNDIINCRVGECGPDWTALKYRRLDPADVFKTTASVDEHVANDSQKLKNAEACSEHSVTATQERGGTLEVHVYEMHTGELRFCTKTYDSGLEYLGSFTIGGE